MTSDELLKQLDEPVGDGHSYRAVVINGQQYNPLHVAAAARIRELEAELEIIRGGPGPIIGPADKAPPVTHVIVPVEPTPEMKEAGWDNQLCGGDETTIYQAMIRAAQPNASD